MLRNHHFSYSLLLADEPEGNSLAKTYTITKLIWIYKVPSKKNGSYPDVSAEVLNVDPQAKETLDHESEDFCSKQWAYLDLLSNSADVPL